MNVLLITTPAKSTYITTEQIKCFVDWTLICNNTDLMTLICNKICIVIAAVEWSPDYII